MVPAGRRLVVRGGGVAAPRGVLPADVAVQDGVIVELGSNLARRPGDDEIDATGRLVLPGFVDAHSHADGMLADRSTQLALLRQGVTTVVAGQDGVSYAPGSGRYASEYFAAINGPYPRYHEGGVAAYLDSVDGLSPLNAAYLVPAGTVRFEVCGRRRTPADAAQRRSMAELVTQGMADGAVGLSTGLDYVPGIFQDEREIAALCVPVARSGGVYVSHMRGGYETNSAAGIAEIARIANIAASAAGAPLPVHVSHFHAPADIVLAQLDTLARAGVDATFDAYPYTRACTLLAMPLLPPELSLRPVDDVVGVLADPGERERLRAACVDRATHSASLGPDWPRLITLAHVAAPEYAWTHGLTLQDAAARVGTDAAAFALDVLAAARLQVNAVMAVRRHRTSAELARVFTHPKHMAGSDGIFVGAHPHPRARGTFARYLREYVRERGAWSWTDAVRHMSTLPVERFGLGARGTVRVGAVADLVVVDPETVADSATYDQPLREAVGVDDVLVAGVRVLSGGELTGARPGRGLRRMPQGNASMSLGNPSMSPGDPSMSPGNPSMSPGNP